MILTGYRPRLRGDIVQVFDDCDPQRSDKTLLIASLLTLGIPPAEREFFHTTCEIIRGAKDWHTIWTLREESRDKRFVTPRMVRAWDDGQWLCANPAHPLAILRGGLTFSKALSTTPRFTLEELASIESPDTWIEAAMRNLIILLRDMPAALSGSRNIIRFGRDHAALVPRCMPESDKSRFIKYVEKPEKRQAAA